MTGAVDIGRLLAGAGPLLLDFDGPVCSIFGGYPAPVIAAELRQIIEARGISIPSEAHQEADPMQVLRWADTLGDQSLTREIEDALCLAELLATESAIPERDGHAVIVAANRANRPVAIVSNNSAGAIRAYLAAHGLAEYIAYVAGRAYAEPGRMKPNPEPIWRATTALSAEPQSCVLVGDSLLDIEGGQAAHVPVIAYANKPPKIRRFVDAHADIVVTSMADIAEVLRNQVPS